MDPALTVLGIETSCDETAAAVVRGDRTVLAERLLSQLDDHRPYGGVVPEIAARAHLDHLDRLVAETMAAADIGYGALDGIAVTGGPGLIGGVMVGVMTAKAIAAVRRFATSWPSIILEAHALTVRPDGRHKWPFPICCCWSRAAIPSSKSSDGVGQYRPAWERHR